MQDTHHALCTKCGLKTEPATRKSHPWRPRKEPYPTSLCCNAPIQVVKNERT